ncbi:MAG TPA: type II toxin-antitoxin system RelE/ParE family toxin [Candidatus Dormibacteraeota bacterium]|nr:type II toxin-antitoxin system RelE/ParE family toxin [Candidatus Dormibacteraeota bacterium]
MKELRPPSSTIRILFVFGPIQAAILLLGGDKAGAWDEWYRREIPLAEKLYAGYLDELKQEGLI